MAILGISTNTRLLGLAIIDQGRLVDYLIRLHKSPWSASKANLIISSLEPCVRKYCIKSVALSIPPLHHQTREYHELIARMKEYFDANDIPLSFIEHPLIYSCCPEGVRKTKKHIIQTLSEQFPILRYCAEKELRNKNKYYIKLFDALAAAV